MFPERSEPHHMPWATLSHHLASLIIRHSLRLERKSLYIGSVRVPNWQQDPSCRVVTPMGQWIPAPIQTWGKLRRRSSASWRMEMRWRGRWPTQTDAVVSFQSPGHEGHICIGQMGDEASTSPSQLTATLVDRSCSPAAARLPHAGSKIRCARQDCSWRFACE